MNYLVIILDTIVLWFIVVIDQLFFNFLNGEQKPMCFAAVF